MCRTWRGGDESGTGSSKGNRRRWWNLLGGFGHVCGRLKIECLASEAELLLAQLALLHAVPQRELCTCSYDVLRNTGLAFRQPRQVGGRCLDKLDNQ